MIRPLIASAAAVVLGACHLVFPYAHAPQAADAAARDGAPARDGDAAGAADARADAVIDAGRRDGAADGSRDATPGSQRDAGTAVCANTYVAGSSTLLALAVGSGGRPHLLSSTSSTGSWRHAHFDPTTTWRVDSAQPGPTPSVVAAAVDAQDTLQVAFSAPGAVSLRRRSVAGATPGPWEPAQPVPLVTSTATGIQVVAEGAETLTFVALEGTATALQAFRSDALAAHAVAPCALADPVGARGGDPRAALSAQHVAVTSHDGLTPLVRVWDRAALCGGAAPLFEAPVLVSGPRPVGVDLSAGAVHLAWVGGAGNLKYADEALPGGGGTVEEAGVSDQPQHLDLALDAGGRAHLLLFDGNTAYWTYRTGPATWAPPRSLGSGSSRALLRQRDGLLHFAWQDGGTTRYACRPVP